MIRAGFLLTAATLALLGTLAHGAVHLLVIQGSAGDPSYQEGFSQATRLWEDLAEEAGAPAETITPDSAGTDSKQKIKDWIQSPARADASSIWIAYIGHGTFNAGGAKLNLPGADPSAAELGQWLAPLSAELVFVHGGSASAPFISELSGENRVIITATRSAAEQNYARFGERFAHALADPASDLDRDQTVSLLEAFLSASAATETFYKEAGRLSSEHALLDDNGDAKGTPATQYSGLRALPAKDGSPVDGRLARTLSLTPQAATPPLSPEQLQERRRLEQELADLYSKKPYMPEDEYYQKLESILNELARFYLAPKES